MYCDAEALRVQQEVEAVRLVSRRRYAVYTCVFNDYSRVLPPPTSLAEAADFFLLSDVSHDTPGWTQICIAAPSSDPRRAAKKYKLLPHLILQGYEASLWVDGNFELSDQIETLFVAVSNSRYPLLLVRHRARNCVYSEAEICSKWGKDDPAKLEAQVERYRAEGHPEKAGLFMGGFLMRRHNDAKLLDAMQQWWIELENGSVRDQLGLPVVLRRTGLSPRIMEFADSLKYFQIHAHSKYSSYHEKWSTNPRALLAPLLYRIAALRSRLSGTGKQIP